MFLGLSKILDVGLGFLVLYLDFNFELLHVFSYLSLGLFFLVPDLSESLLEFLDLCPHLLVVMFVRKVFVIHIFDLGIKFTDLILVHLHVVVDKLDQLLHINLLPLGHFCFEVLILLLDEIVLFEDFGEAVLGPFH